MRPLRTNARAPVIVSSIRDTLGRTHDTAWESTGTNPAHGGRGSYLAFWLFPLSLEIEAMDMRGLEPPLRRIR